MNKDIILPLPTFRVVKIIDDETIVINAGSNIGISPGDMFEIFETGNIVTDPNTGESLGTLDTIKDTVEAINVFPKMCVCRHYITYNAIGSITSSLTKTTAKTLNVDISQISGGLSSDKTIRLGDKVRQIKNKK